MSRDNAIKEAAQKLVDYGKQNGFNNELLKAKAEVLSVEYNISTTDILFSATAKMAYDRFINTTNKSRYNGK